MSSREIAELTGKRHDNVKRDIDKMCSQVNPSNLRSSNYEHNGNTYIQYHLDKKLTLCLVSGYNAALRMKIIDRLDELESQKLQVIPNFSDPAQAARAWAEQYEANTIKQKQLELAAPKVEFHDKIVNDDQSFSCTNAAKKIQQRPNKFIEWLRDNGYLCLNNIAKQQYITQGLFATHTGVSDAGHHYTQCRVTSKGLSYFTSKLGDKKL